MPRAVGSGEKGSRELSTRFEELLAKSAADYELHLEVAELLRNRRDADPYHAGLSSLCKALRFVAIFGDRKKGLPFLEDARRFLVPAAAAAGADTSAAFNPERAYQRMRIFWGFYGVLGVLGESGGGSLLASARQSIAPTFVGGEFRRLRKRILKGVEELRSVSVVQMVFLSLSILAAAAGHEASERQLQNCLRLSVVDRYRGLRDALGRVAMERSEEARSAFESEFRSAIHLQSYHRGLVAGLTFDAAWLLSVVRNGGDRVAGAERLFFD